MEELRSTEVLDREILDDARKKAHKILKTADDTLAAQNRDWEKKIQEALDSIRAAYAERVKKTTGEILARFPLDKRRLRSETSERFLTGAMDDFLRSLERGKLLFILERELSGRVRAAAGDAAGFARGEGTGRAEVRCSGMTRAEVKTVLAKVSLSGDWEIKEAPGSVPAGALSAGGELPSVVIDAGTVRITASVEHAAAALLKDKRAELAGALLGEGVLND